MNNTAFDKNGRKKQETYNQCHKFKAYKKDTCSFHYKSKYLFEIIYSLFSKAAKARPRYFSAPSASWR